VVVPIERVLVSGPDIRVTVMGAVAYTTGFKLWLGFLRRTGETTLMRRRVITESVDQAQDTEPFVQVEVVFADGRRASTRDENADSSWRLTEPPHPPIALSTMADVGGQVPRNRVAVWIWPLPSPGPLTIAVEWSDAELLTTACEINATPIIDAGARSETLWDDDPAWQVETN
jgi:hypothetical protein